MGKRMGRYTVVMERKPAILGYAAICGKKESEGPLGAAFDLTYEDTTLGEKSWEKAESRLQKEAVNCAMKKAGVTAGAVDYIFAGDLLNQCISSTFGLRSLGIPFLGQYGACSTMAQTLAMSSFLVDGGMANLCVAVTSSHFCSAERQFRFPLEYGGQRTPTAQWTVTGSGAAVVGMGGIESGEDAIAFLLVGCTAVQVGTANLHNPYACMDVIRGMEEYGEKYGVQDVRELIGALRLD